MTQIAPSNATAVIAVSSRKPPRSTGGRVGTWLRTVWPPLVAFVLICTIWEIIVRVTGMSKLVLPAPSDISGAMSEYSGMLLPAVWTTLVEVVIGLAVSIVTGILLAVLIVSVPVLERAIYPLLVALQMVPMVAIAPLLIIWFGFDLIPKIIMVVLISFFPIVINTAIGLRSIDIEKLYLARSMGAGPFTTLFRFRIPQALPNIFGGVKIATTVSVIGAVIAEFMGGQAGLGYVLQTANSHMNPSLMFASIVYLTVIGMLLYLVVNIVERLALPWHVSRRGSFNSSKK